MRPTGHPRPILYNVNLLPAELAVLVTHYEERIRTALTTWPRNAVTEKRLGQLHARLSELVGHDESLPDAPALVTPSIIQPGPAIGPAFRG